MADKIVVIGAGLAGTLTALKLAEQCPDAQIILLEAGESIIPACSSSQNECYKIHVGMHYLNDFDTMRFCLEKATEFLSEFSDYVSGKDSEETAHLLESRHYVLDASLGGPENACKNVERLREEYKKMIQGMENPPFGTAEEFIKELETEKYSHLIADNIPYHKENGEKHETTIAKAYTVKEYQLNMPKLKTHLVQRIQDTSNITFIPHTKVSNIELEPDGSGYVITTDNTISSEFTEGKIKADGMVNCAWQNTELLNKGIGSTDGDEKTVNRAKISILIKLPEKLLKLNPTMFSVGPFVTIHPLPDGTAVLTSERKTNIGSYPSNQVIPEELQKKLDDLHVKNADGTYAKNTDGKKEISEDGSQLAREIIEDCAACFSGSRDLHLLTHLPLPTDLAQYKDSYILCRNDDTKNLYYIKSDGVAEEVIEEVNIIDFAKFERDLPNSENDVLHLSVAKIKELITSNGGHAPPESAQSLFLDAEVLEVRVGFVKSQSADIYSEESGIHRRVKTGVSPKFLCGITNAGMKMCYALFNAIKAALLMKEDLGFKEKLPVFMEKVLKNALRLNESDWNNASTAIYRTLYVNFVDQVRDILKGYDPQRDLADHDDALHAQIYQLVKDIKTAGILILQNRPKPSEFGIFNHRDGRSGGSKDEPKHPKSLQ